MCCSMCCCRVCCRVCCSVCSSVCACATRAQCCSVLQRVLRRSVLHYVCMCHPSQSGQQSEIEGGKKKRKRNTHNTYKRKVSSVLQCVAVCCRVLQGVAGCCSVLQCVAVCCRVLLCVAVCCSALQCVVVCCSVLQCVAMVTMFIIKKYTQMHDEQPHISVGHSCD